VTSAQAELLGEAVAEVGGADLRDRQAAGGDHDPGRFDGTPVAIDLIATNASGIGFGGGKCDLPELARLPALDPACRAFGQQHVDDLLRRTIAKQLPLVLLVEGDAVLLHQFDELLWCIARQRRAAEIRVVADEVALRRAHVEVAVGEVGPAAARNADLLSDLFAVVDQQHLEPALARQAGAKKPGGTGTDHDDIELGRCAQGGQGPSAASNGGGLYFRCPM
jgi:hypothetical protein